MRCSNSNCHSVLRDPYAVKGDICSYCKKDYKVRHSDEEAHAHAAKFFEPNHPRLKTVPTDMYLDIYTMWELRIYFGV